MNSPKFFERIGQMPVEVSLKTKANVEPVVNSLRKIPVALRDRVRVKLDEMEQQGVIE